MAQAVLRNWYGQLANFGGPLDSGSSDSWVGTGTFGPEDRFYVVNAFCEGPVTAELEVRNISRSRRQDADGNLVDETHFEIFNRGSAAPVNYFFYIGWSDPIAT